MFYSLVSAGQAMLPRCICRDARRALSTTLDEGLRIEADLSTLAFQMREAAEGMLAFVEKRQAEFRDASYQRGLHRRHRRKPWHRCKLTVIAQELARNRGSGARASTALIGFMLANIGVYSSLAIFWSIPQTYLAAKVRPAAIALISSFGALFGGWLAPMYIGKAQGYFHSLPMGMAIVAALLVISSFCVGGAGTRLARIK